jgi:hypothetical protein
VKTRHSEGVDIADDDEEIPELFGSVSDRRGGGGGGGEDEEVDKGFA